MSVSTHLWLKFEPPAASTGILCYESLPLEEFISDKVNKIAEILKDSSRIVVHEEYPTQEQLQDLSGKHVVIFASLEPTTTSKVTVENGVQIWGNNCSHDERPDFGDLGTISMTIVEENVHKLAQSNGIIAPLEGKAFPINSFLKLIYTFNAPHEYTDIKWDFEIVVLQTYPLAAIDMNVDGRYTRSMISAYDPGKTITYLKDVLKEVFNESVQKRCAEHFWDMGTFYAAYSDSKPQRRLSGMPEKVRQAIFNELEKHWRDYDEVAALCFLEKRFNISFPDEIDWPIKGKDLEQFPIILFSDAEWPHVNSEEILTKYPHLKVQGTINGEEAPEFNLLELVKRNAQLREFLRAPEAFLEKLHAVT
jgi:hypothetical protein